MKQPYNTTIYNTALYMRLSRDDELQGESGSIQTQRMMLRQYAAKHGLNVIDEYIDDGWSGTNFNRPAFVTEDHSVTLICSTRECFFRLFNINAVKITCMKIKNTK